MKDKIDRVNAALIECIEAGTPVENRTPEEVELLEAMLNLRERIRAPYKGLARLMGIAAVHLERAVPVPARWGSKTLTNDGALSFDVQRRRMWLARMLVILAPAVERVWEAEMGRAMLCTDGEALREAMWASSKISGVREAIVTELRVAHATGVSFAEAIDQVERGGK